MNYEKQIAQKELKPDDNGILNLRWNLSLQPLMSIISS